MGGLLLFLILGLVLAQSQGLNPSFSSGSESSSGTSSDQFDSSHGPGFCSRLISGPNSGLMSAMEFQKDS